MKHREILKVYFKMNGMCYKLFNAIQMGKNGGVDLKFTDYYGGVCVICGGNVDPDEGYLTDEEIQKTYFVRKQEMSYHKDGSLLNKNKDFKKPIYTNPLGEGIRCTPTDSIDSLQPLFFLDIRRLNIYRPTNLPEEEKGTIVYVCENDSFFNENYHYIAISYIYNKTMVGIRHYMCDFYYSAKLIDLNEHLSLGLLMMKGEKVEEKLYNSKYFGLIRPSLVNTIGYLDECNTHALVDILQKYGIVYQN